MAFVGAFIDEVNQFKKYEKGIHEECPFHSMAFQG